MWDEEINKKIKDAADQYHPAYDDSAWNKMEQMLDEHLPRKKDRRRIIYFLPIVVLLTGILFFMISRKETIPSAKNSEKTVLLKGTPVTSQNESAKTLPGEKEIASVPAPVKAANGLVADVKAKKGLMKQPSVNATNPVIKKVYSVSTGRNVGISDKNTQPPSENPALNDNRQKEDKPLAIQESANINSNGKDKSDVAETVSKTTKPSNEQMTSPAGADNDTPVKGVNTIVKAGENETIKSTDVSKAQNPKDANGNIKQGKIKKSFIRNFGFGLSLGPDVSGVKLSNTGKVTLTYGGLVSYSINDKFTLRSGFYVANKIYSADKDEYYASSGSTWNAYLQSVDAKCKVYEIPLTVSYNFSKTKNHNLFASAGLSSYFMKRESYIYYYKNSADSTYNRPWSVQNKNKHYFSVLNISAGYEYSVNKRISVTGEPYLKLPLSGIGAGKIKLNSAGVIFTVAIKPF